MDSVSGCIRVIVVLQCCCSEGSCQGWGRVRVGGGYSTRGSEGSCQGEDKSDG